MSRFSLSVSPLESIGRGRKGGIVFFFFAFILRHGYFLMGDYLLYFIFLFFSFFIFIHFKEEREPTYRLGFILSSIAWCCFGGGGAAVSALLLFLF